MLSLDSPRKQTQSKMTRSNPESNALDHFLLLRFVSIQFQFQSHFWSEMITLNMICWAGCLPLLMLVLLFWWMDFCCFILNSNQHMRVSNYDRNDQQQHFYGFGMVQWLWRKFFFFFLEINSQYIGRYRNFEGQNVIQTHTEKKTIHSSCSCLNDDIAK